MHSPPPSPSLARRTRVFTSSEPETVQGVKSSKPSSSRIRSTSAASAAHTRMREVMTGSHRKNNSLPFKGRVRVGMDLDIPPHPHPPPAEGGAGSKRLVLGCDPGAGCCAASSPRAYVRLHGRIPGNRAPAPRSGALPPEGEGVGFFLRELLRKTTTTISAR